MEFSELSLNIEHVGNSGIMLTLEQKAALQSSLCIAKEKNKFEKVYFWGKIIGVRDDYFIAQGIGKNYMGGKRTLYSKECVNWALLPPATQAMKESAQKAIGCFTGDPSFELDYEDVITKADGSTEQTTVTVKEEERLAAVISEIDHDTDLVPRGAFKTNPHGQIDANRTWEGLSIDESAKLSNYMHMREGIKIKEKTLLQKSNLNKAIDFMDTIDEDIPKGTWSIQFERGSGLVIIKSLQWIGYVFYYKPETKNFGSIYVGNGQKNKDILFML